MGHLHRLALLVLLALIRHMALPGMVSAKIHPSELNGKEIGVQRYACC